jgi:uncharacterized protein YoxC
MLFEICAGISTLVFVVIAYYLIKTLIILQKSLKEISAVTKKFEIQIQPLSEETSHFLRRSAGLTESVTEKLEAFDPLLKSISHLNSMLNETFFSIHERIKERKKGQWNLNEFIELVTLGLLVWQKVKKGDQNDQS